MAKKDYYEILGVDKKASDAELKSAYRKLAQKHHPDKKGGDEARFKEINEAYQTLSNKEKRAQYDRFGSTFAGGGGSANSGWGFNGGGFNGSVNMEDLGDFSDIFESFFGGGRGRSSARRTYRRGSDLQVVQEITLEQAYSGVTKELQFKTFAVCEICQGEGHDVKEGTKKCQTCGGQGEVREVRQSVFGNVEQIRACSDCRGVGEVPNKVCQECHGSGRVEKKRLQKIEIIPGVANGQLIKVPGAGEVGERKAGAGDLYIQVNVAKHPLFHREGVNLYLQKEISLLDVLLNKKIEIPLIAGDPIHVEIPAGFSFTQQFKVENKGMPHLHSKNRGDLLVTFEVKKPNHVSKKAKQLLEALEKEL